MKEDFYSVLGPINTKMAIKTKQNKKKTQENTNKFDVNYNYAKTYTLFVKGWKKIP